MATSFPTLQNLGAGAIPVWDTGGAIATNGVNLPIGQLPMVLGYDGSNNLITLTVVYLTHTYTQTFTYTSGNLTGVSAWVQTA